MRFCPYFSKIWNCYANTLLLYLSRVFFFKSIFHISVLYLSIYFPDDFLLLLATIEHKFLYFLLLIYSKLSRYLSTAHLSLAHSSAPCLRRCVGPAACLLSEGQRKTLSVRRLVGLPWSTGVEQPVPVMIPPHALSPHDKDTDKKSQIHPFIGIHSKNYFFLFCVTPYRHKILLTNKHQWKHNISGGCNRNRM